MFDLSLLGPESVRPIKRSEYERLVAEGLFADEKLELLHGVLVTMSPQGTVHAEAIELLHEVLARQLGDRAKIRVHSPFAANDSSMPEPDLAVVARRSYAAGHPSKAFLIVEAADSSLQKDRRIKAPLYAASGVPEYWILDLEARVIEVHRDPAATGYLSIDRHEAEAIFSLAAFPDVSVGVGAIIPRG